MQTITNTLQKPARPVRAVQFGAGVFLRGFADWMLEELSERCGWEGSVAVVKSTARPGAEALTEQHGLYTAALRGLANGAPTEAFRAVRVIDRVLNASRDYAEYAALAQCPTLRFVLSNTTEAGIAPDDGDEFSLRPPRSYPGKLTKFLYERAEHFDYAPDKGLIVLPCELIERNGQTLRTLVLRNAERWGLGARFIDWVARSCAFADTLVDRIVTGYPADAPALWQKLGYRDEALVAAEPYALWVIACAADVERELPLQRAGLPVIYTHDLTPYRTRKVRVLNGAHTAFVPAAYLAGFTIVRDAVLDEDFSAFIRSTLDKEVLPTIDQPRAELNAYAASVLERFANPYIDHNLLAICLNSASKWRARNLPTLLDCAALGLPAPRLAFSLAALIALYKTHPDRMQDDPAALDCLIRQSVPDILKSQHLWGMDLAAIPGFAEQVEIWFARIQTQGVRACIKELGA